MQNKIIKEILKNQGKGSIYEIEADEVTTNEATWDSSTLHCITQHCFKINQVSRS